MLLSLHIEEICDAAKDESVYCECNRECGVPGPRDALNRYF